MPLELVAGWLLASLLRRPGLCPKTCLFLACLRALAASSPGFRGPELPSFSEAAAGTAACRISSMREAAALLASSASSTALEYLHERG